MTHDLLLPEHVSHYTSIAGLIGIMKSSALWATHITQLNDPNENQTAVGVLEKVHAIDEQLYVQTYKVRDRDDLFVSSLSAAQDHLGMWRPYNSRIEIVFNTERLVATVEELNRDVGARFAQTSYEEIDLEERLSTLLAPDSTDPAGPYEVAILAASHKSAHWSDEKEYRFVGLVHSHDGGREAARVQFREGEVGLSPYIELLLSPRGPNGQPLNPLPFDLISEIRVGPKGDQNALVRALEVVANQHLSPEGDSWPITRSEQSYR
ncbi:hypothetical protein [Rathayibacter sp. VKM Ac-2926]|uniref:hypothetical protein n=2 Tax=Rathayibacter TaxID=33886 RepID=UPI001FB49CCE|nr:hypothetical protein [Rathayibacter sp. VKM Ac-2926]MCJ1705526.1 hypothetical protein [Rathayibacter sp. VKM Ac-2926]